ncbi:MAG: lecithin retinol acyltransferase family protein [Bacillales bacterium]|jgi:hypothetical protein|nr:lecithin retinol acyltransferase family protein [Bacillales bacterium]
MEFKDNITPNYSNQIRVNRGLYFHYGIYIDKKHVIQFGSPTSELNPLTAEVMIVTLKQFLKDNKCEVGVLNNNELAIVRKPADIINYAMLKLGSKGYDILRNNCEHFVNECFFDKKESSQVDKALSFLKDLFK